MMKKSIIHTLQSINKVLKESEQYYDLTQLPVKLKNFLRQQTLPDLQNDLENIYPYKIEDVKFDIANFTTNVDKIKIYEQVDFTCHSDILNDVGNVLLNEQDILNNLENIVDNHLYISDEGTTKKVRDKLSISIDSTQYQDKIVNMLSDYNNSLNQLISNDVEDVTNTNYFSRDNVGIKAFLTDSIYTKNGVESSLPTSIIIDLQSIIFQIAKSFTDNDIFKDIDIESFAKYGDLTIFKYLNNITTNTSSYDTVVYELANWSDITDKVTLIKLFIALGKLLTNVIINGTVPEDSVEYLYKGYLVVSVDFSVLNDKLLNKDFEGQQKMIVLNFLNQEPIKDSNSITPNMKYIMNMLMNNMLMNIDLQQDKSEYFKKILKYSNSLNLTKNELIDAIHQVEEQNGSELMYDAKNTYISMINKYYTN